MKLQKIHIIGLTLVVVGLLLLGWQGKVFGNASIFGPRAASATASSSPQFLVAGSATQATSTSVVYDSYNVDGTNQTNNGGTDIPDMLSLKEYVQASSTLTVYKTWVEYSDGVPGVSCVSSPNACDWYENNLETYAAGSIAIATPNTWTYTYASTSQGQILSPTNENRGAKIFSVRMPTRYVRAYVTIAGKNGSVYLEWVPKRQLR